MKAVEMDPTLRDYCEWRRRALEKKARQRQLELTGDAATKGLQDAAVKLRGCGMAESSEVQRLEAMKVRLASLGYLDDEAQSHIC